MRVLYFDCFSGISGNMILGGLLDLGVPQDLVEKDLAKLDMEGFELVFSVEQRGNLRGIRVAVEPRGPLSPHERTFKEIRSLIEKSQLTERVKQRGIEAFLRLAQAEGRIHGKDPEEVHFHEVGALDSIVDVIGSFVAIEYLGVDAVYASRMPLGRGMVECRHGVIPIPAPATVELLKGVPVFDPHVEGELVTPTGAAWITTLADKFGTLPDMEIEAVGYGLGDREIKNIPNALRVILGKAAASLREDRVVLVETDIDDMNPEFFEPLMERLFASGALDVLFVPIHMKKNRPGVMVRAICEEIRHADVVETILSQSTSIGVRYFTAFRKKLERRIESVETPYGPVRVKFSWDEGRKIRHVAPEYEDCRRLSSLSNIPIMEIYQEALLAANKIQQSPWK